MALQLHAEGRSHYSFLFTARLLAGTHSINRTFNLATCNSVAFCQLKYLDAGSLFSSFCLLCSLQQSAQSDGHDSDLYVRCYDDTYVSCRTISRGDLGFEPMTMLSVGATLFCATSKQVMVYQAKLAAVPSHEPLQ